MYNRQQELANLHASHKPSPPKEIRLVSAPPAPAPATPAIPEQQSLDNEMDEQELKTGGVEDILAAAGLAHAVSPDESDASNTVSKANSPLTAPRSVESAPGTVAMETASGPVTIEAEDPRSAKILHNNTATFKRIMGILQAQTARPDLAA